MDAFQTIFSHGAWAGTLVAALAVISGTGALNGWTLVTTEVSRAAASDGLCRCGDHLRPQGLSSRRHRTLARTGPAEAQDRGMGRGTLGSTRRSAMTPKVERIPQVSG